MRFTIVTPVLNGMPWLPTAMESVARQRDGADFELEHIILDGGSTDGSREWLLAHPEIGAQLIFEPDSGQTLAMRAGFERATGELLGWLNADDILEPGALSLAHRVFVENPDAAMVSAVSLFIREDGAVVGAMATPPVPTFERLVRSRFNPAQPSTFFRAEAYREVGGLDVRWNLAQDLDLWLRLSKVGRYITLPDVVLARYRVHPAAKSERMAVASAREDLRVRRTHGMPWRSHAGNELLWKAYLDPTIGRVPKALRASLRNAARFVAMGRRRT